MLEARLKGAGDTSLHLLPTVVPIQLPMTAVQLGAWQNEYNPLVQARLIKELTFCREACLVLAACFCRKNKLPIADTMFFIYCCRVRIINLHMFDQKDICQMTLPVSSTCFLMRTAPKVGCEGVDDLLAGPNTKAYPDVYCLWKVSMILVKSLEVTHDNHVGIDLFIDALGL